MLLDHIQTSDCASCQLCCHFAAESDWELQRLTTAEQNFFSRLGVALEERSPGDWTFVMDWETCPEGETLPCPFLEPQRGCRLSREDRPLECRVWPLRLMRTEGNLHLTCYRDCAALNEPARREAFYEFARAQFSTTEATLGWGSREAHSGYDFLAPLI